MRDNAQPNATTSHPAAEADEPGAILETLQISRIQRRSYGSPGGTWVNGVIANHTFEALVFPDHAQSESYELGDSRISKLWLRDDAPAPKKEVACFDRGWDRKPETPTARAIVDLLAAGLAERVFSV